jgi:SNF2 family DNA or RNA helicase
VYVLHVHWHMPESPEDESGILVWAETSTGEHPKRDRRRRSAQPHPFLLFTNELQTHLQTSLPHSISQRVFTVWLPTNAYGPVPSPDLIHDWEQADGSDLLPWEVSGLWLDARSAFQFFVALTDHTIASLRPGSDLLYWQYAFNLVLEGLAQQKYRPTLIEIQTKKDMRYEARWQPVLDSEEDARRITQLALAMPPICRAGAATPEETIPPRALLDSFLNHLTDAGIRLWASVPLAANHQPHDSWLRALFQNDPVVQASQEQLRHLFSSYRAWVRTLTIAGDKHYRVAFRLEAPDLGEQDWKLHYLLQARDDASLVVSADDVWEMEGGALDILGRRFKRPQERLLAGLGYAGRFFAPIQRSLQKQNPASVKLSSQEAFDFLRTCAPQLQQSGFGLLTPPWWNKPGTRLGVRLKLDSNRAKGAAEVSTGHMSFDKLINYRWQLLLGDTALTREEFDALVALKSPLVQIRGQWVQLDPDQIEKAIGFWEKQELEGDLSILEAMQLSLGGVDTHSGLPVEGVEIDHWLDQWFDTLQGEEALEILPPPDNLHATLRPYQEYGYSWLDFARRWGMGAILADDMGLGKTIQTLAMIQKMKSEFSGLPAPVLLVCPTSVVTNWKIESDRFTPDLKTMIHQGGERLRDEAFLEVAQGVDMVLTSYALVRRDAEVMRQIDWLGVVLDEAQNIKNPVTKQAQVIRSLQSEFRLALTGTPVENRLSELWSIMHFLNPGFLGSRTEFRREFTLPIEKYGDEQATNRLRRLTRPFILRRLKTDPTVIQDLPDKQEMKVYCNLSEEQATLYEAVVQNALQTIEEQEEGIQRKGMVLSMLMQLKQICNHPVQYLHQGETYSPFEDHNRSGKLTRFHAILEEVLAEGDRMLIFSQFTEMGDLLKQYIQERFGVQTLFLHGGTRPQKRTEMVERFQSNDGPPVFILSLKAGGTGLNLTSANHVFHFDRWWNPAVEDQATDRAFRIGQSRNVMVHKFVCLGTLEEQIDQMIEEKKALAESIVGAGENWLTEMSTADLRALVELRAV